VHFASDRLDFNEETGTRSLLQSAVLSLAHTFFGNQHKDRQMCQAGSRLYGKTLVSLNSALGHPVHAQRDDVLIAIITLGLRECLVPSGRTSWLMHIQGLERLLEIRGPASHANPFSRRILQGIRRMLIFASLYTEKPSVLSRPEWKNLEWESDNIQHSTDQYLLTILADCPALLNLREDMIRQLEAEQTTSALYLRQKALEMGNELLSELQTWHSCWIEPRQRPANDANAELFSWDFTSPPTSPLPAVSEFSDPAVATTMMLYHATQIYILDLMASIIIVPPSSLTAISDGFVDPRVFAIDLDPVAPSPHKIASEQRDYLARLQHAALNTCRIIPYHCSQRDRLDAGSLHIGAMAIHLTWRAFNGESSVEGRWLRDVIRSYKFKVTAKALWKDIDKSSEEDSQDDLQDSEAEKDQSTDVLTLRDDT
jgi:hypothetical protein